MLQHHKTPQSLRYGTIRYYVLQHHKTPQPLFTVVPFSMGLKGSVSTVTNPYPLSSLNPLSALPYPALPHPTLPCPALPCPTALPYPALLPCPTLPYPTLPCPALPYPALPHPALPYPTLPFFTHADCAALTHALTHSRWLRRAALFGRRLPWPSRSVRCWRPVCAR